MDTPGFLFAAFAVNLTVCTTLWAVALVRRNVTVADPFWGLGFAITAVVLFPYAEGRTARAALVGGMAVLWGLRFALHLYWRPWGHEESDTYFPYADWRRTDGDSFWWTSYFRVFLTQAAGTVVVGLPVWVSMCTGGTRPLGAFDALGVLAWSAGFSMEAIADYQLASFKRERGRGVLAHGLWRYSRHPNYFGDALVWWGFWFVALSTGGGAWTVVSPVFMTYALVRVSGVVLVESRSAVARDPAYEEYSRRTNAFVPGKPRPPLD